MKRASLPDIWARRARTRGKRTVGVEYFLTYAPEDSRNRRWRNRWWARYKGILFHQVDYNQAANQPRYRFREWLAAVYYYENYGYKSVLKYHLPKSHADAAAVVKKRVGSEVAELLITSGGTPDLFLYHPRRKRDWFFVETKGLRERFTDTQEELFPRLRAALRRDRALRSEIVVLRVGRGPVLPPGRTS